MAVDQVALQASFLAVAWELLAALAGTINHFNWLVMYAIRLNHRVVSFTAGASEQVNPELYRVV